MKVIVVMGRGGQGRVILDAALSAGLEVAGILDNAEDGATERNGIPILGPVDGWRTHLDYAFVLTTGSRERLALAAGGHLATVVHSRAWVSSSAALGEGAMIASGVTVNANASIGEVVIINANCSIDHDCVLEAGAQLGPGVTFPGNVHVGDCAFVGAGAVALPGISIGANAVVGAGAVVTKDVPDDTIVAGNPARARE